MPMTCAAIVGALVGRARVAAAADAARPSARTCHVAGTNLSTTEWKRLVEKQQLLDKRVSSTVAMLAYGTAALPSTCGGAFHEQL